jgi:hypothetical protein
VQLIPVFARLRAILALVVAGLAVASVLAPAPAQAQSAVLFRGNYWRDRNTRVLQPEVDLSKELPTGTTIGTHYLLDAITSASVAAGVTSDQPFTELRNEFGVNVAQRLKSTGQIGASYTYSSESDYWANLVTLSGSVDLNQRNTTLALALAYGHDNVGQRLNGTLATLGTLDSFRLIAGWTQVLSPTLLANFTFDAGVIGFGNKDNGFQANPYRTVLLGGSPNREVVPFQRIRLAWTLALHMVAPIGSRVVPFLAFRPAYRIYWDDWGILSHTPELRMHLPIGLAELRITGRYYKQGAASFYREQFGTPAYVNTPGEPNGAAGAPCPTCLGSFSHGPNALFFTADPKLSAFGDMLLDVRLLLKLRFTERISHWFSEGTLELMYGHLFESRYALTAFGDSDLAGVQFSFPL